MCIPMLSEEQREKLRVRADLDRIEAESEVAQRERSGTYKKVFTETARQSLEEILTRTPEQWEELRCREQEEIDAAMAQVVESEEKVIHLALVCPLYFTRKGRVTRENGDWNTVNLLKSDGTRLRLLNVHAKTYCEREVARDSSLNPRFLDPIGRRSMYLPDSKLTKEGIERGVREWLTKFYPALKDSRILLENTEAEDFDVWKFLRFAIADLMKTAVKNVREALRGKR